MAGQANLLIDSLSADLRETLLGRCVAVPLPRRTILFEPEQMPAYGYFVTSGMASVIATMEDGASAEVSVMGREGLAGSLQVIGPGRVPMTCVMQLDGTGLRMPMTEMHTLFRESVEFRGRVLESVQEQASLMGKIAGCNRLHEAEERLARWLLMAADRVGGHELNFTQEFLAELLGARRTTVTMVAGTLQRAGLIEYKRGRVRIINREELIEAACECYPLLANLNNGMYATGTAAVRTPGAVVGRRNGF